MTANNVINVPRHVSCWENTVSCRRRRHHRLRQEASAPNAGFKGTIENE